MTTKTEKRKLQKLKAAAGAAADRIANDDQVNSFARQHGDYVREGNKAAINRGGTPVARWTRDGLLSETQTAAIQFCIKLWDRADRHTKLVQDLLAVKGQPASSGWAQQEALDELRDLKQRVPAKYWNVFENVVRFDEPAGTAGSKLAADTRSAAASARIIVCFVADLIAAWKRL